MEPGCWIKSSRFGRAVLISVEDRWFNLRYEAVHNISNQTIWVYNNDNEVKFIGPPDEQSKRILSLRRPYSQL